MRMSDESSGGEDAAESGDHGAEPKRKKELPRSELYGNIADVMLGLNTRLPCFPVRFYVVEPMRGIRKVLREGPDGVVEYVDSDDVVNTILSYTRFMDRAPYKWEYRHAQECMRFWRATVQPIPEPPALRWQGEEGLCFNRLPWAFNPDGAVPLFDELFGRMTNGPALMDWVGSLFDPGSDRQQYAWLYGQGQNGKGALMRFLHRVLGMTCVSKNPPPPGQEARWCAGLIGARLVLFPDCNNEGFPASGLFKSLTGGDPVDIDAKYEKPYTAKLICKILFSSNGRPRLSSEKADMRRAIYCELGAIQGAADPTYEDQLWREGGVFLSRAIESYQANYPDHGPIACDTTDLEDHVSVVEEPYEVFFEDSFEIAPGAVVEPKRMQVILKGGGFKSVREQSDFLAWLERTHRIRKRQRFSDGRRLYEGLKEKVRPMAWMAGE